jgi:hypothetical protein
MRTIIVIAILAIVAYGLYRTLKIDNETPSAQGGVGASHGNEHTGDEKEPQPDDQDHDDTFEK